MHEMGYVNKNLEFQKRGHISCQGSQGPVSWKRWDSIQFWGQERKEE